jgi:nucleotide-binding universal stress UspA family protein
MYKKILIATDGKHHSSSAVIEAIEIARKFGSEIYLLHALKKMVVSDQFGLSHSVIEQKMEASTKKYMETFKGLAIDDGVVKFETIVSYGKDFHTAILEEAEKRNIDLIMIGRRSMSAMSRLILKGVTDKLLRSLPCNVLIVPFTALIQWKNIILVTDYFQRDEAVINEALKLSKLHGSNLIIVSEDAKKKNREKEIEIISRQIDKEGIKAEPLSASGKLYDFIAAVAKEKDADVIITGSPENGESRSFFKGSLIDKILDRSICAVLVVKR